MYIYTHTHTYIYEHTHIYIYIYTHIYIYYLKPMVSERPFDGRLDLEANIAISISICIFK